MHFKKVNIHIEHGNPVVIYQPSSINVVLTGSLANTFLGLDISQGHRCKWNKAVRLQQLIALPTNEEVPLQPAHSLFLKIKTVSHSPPWNGLLRSPKAFIFLDTLHISTEETQKHFNILNSWDSPCVWNFPIIQRNGKFTKQKKTKYSTLLACTAWVKTLLLY